MQRCLELAAKGLGKTRQNPLVGALLVNCDGVIGEGYHEDYGGAHAEINALAKVSDHTKTPNSTLFVNLEPCVHHGQTPPCVDAIVNAGIKKVVVGGLDPDPRVDGAGIARLREAGVDVSTGVLEEQCLELNRRFYTYHTESRPYVVLKWAETEDGFIARSDFDSKWISSEESRVLTHRWRAEEAAIMVGTNTILQDNPKLTVRHVDGKNPIRLFLDRSLKVPSDFNVYDRSVPTIIFNSESDEVDENLTLAQINFDENVLPQILTYLAGQRVTSLFVEGGAKLLTSFIEADLWDEARIFRCPKTFDAGIPAPTVNGKTTSEQQIDCDQLVTIRR